MSSFTPSIDSTEIKSTHSGSTSRPKVFWALYICYLVPFVLLAAFAFKYSHKAHYGALAVLAASLALFGCYFLKRGLHRLNSTMMLAMERLLVSKTESLQVELEEANRKSAEIEIQEKVVEVLPEEERLRLQKLEDSLTHFKGTYQKLREEFEGLQAERESMLNRNAQMEQKCMECKTALQGLQEEKERQRKGFENTIQELQKAIKEQRILVKQKQGRVEKLESKVLDLKYEVKTLLELESMNHPSIAASQQTVKKKCSTIIPHEDSFENLEEVDLEELDSSQPVSSDPSFQSHYDRLLQLKKCVGIASKMKGVQHLTHAGARFSEMNMDRHMIDLRRLFKNLRKETAAIVLLYSRKEHRLLFANPEVRGILGWSPEKFVKDFPQIVQEGFSDWDRALSMKEERPCGPVSLQVRTKEGAFQNVYAYLGVIPEGAFSDDVIGVLYPAA